MTRLKINISCPDNWNFREFLISHCDNPDFIFSDYQFFLNESSGTFDYWIILDKIDTATRLTVPKGNIGLITMEEKDVVSSYHQEYLNQFDFIITSRSDIKHHNLNKEFFFPKWHLGKSINFIKTAAISKQRNLSAIISTKVEFGDHKKRYAFINKLQGHFKSELDWFSKDDNPINSKWDGLAPYKYTIAVENGIHPLYITEKLLDGLLAECVTFYWGTEDVSLFFPEELVVPIDLKNWQKSIRTIESTMNSTYYEKHKHLFKEAKEKILNELNFYPWLVRILDSKELKGKDTNTRISPETHFTQTYFRRLINKVKGYES